MQFFNVFFYCLVIFTTSCNILKKNSATEIENGDYKIKNTNGLRKAYIVFEDSIVRLFPYNKKNINTSDVYHFEFGETKKIDTSLHLRKSSFDFDVFTIPFKYRPSVSNFPNQLNTNFSGAVYIGYRTDNYRLGYKQIPLDNYQRRLNHIGYSIGMFGGLGSTAINPWVTQNSINSEYDGIVFLNGIAGIVAAGNLTFGIGLGVDHLLDKNKDAWIYQGKLWLGLTVGLNLN